MAAVRTDRELCEALSDLFVDNEVDYDAIAAVAQHFRLADVETVLFEWVAPVCYSNMRAPIPFVWCGFEPEQLWRNIAEHRRQAASTGVIGRGLLWGKQRYLRHQLATEWRELVKHIAKHGVRPECEK